MRLFRLFCRMKYFCAWLATCVGVRDKTNWRLMPRQSPCGGGAASRASAAARNVAAGRLSRHARNCVIPAPRARGTATVRASRVRRALASQRRRTRLAQPLQAKEEQPVLLLCPRHTCVPGKAARA